MTFVCLTDESSYLCIAVPIHIQSILYPMILSKENIQPIQKERKCLKADDCKTYTKENKLWNSTVF